MDAEKISLFYGKSFFQKHFVTQILLLKNSSFIYRFTLLFIHCAIAFHGHYSAHVRIRYIIYISSKVPCVNFYKMCLHFDAVCQKNSCNFIRRSPRVALIESRWKYVQLAEQKRSRKQWQHLRNTSNTEEPSFHRPPNSSPSMLSRLCTIHRFIRPTKSSSLYAFLIYCVRI